MILATKTLFQSFFLGGFECASQGMAGERRVDMVEFTAHTPCARADYARLKSQGLATARDGIRWHLIEHRPGQYDFSTALPLVRAARDTGVQVIWDLCHYGWPDDLDLFAPAFVERFARFARAFTELLLSETSGTPFLAPMNEISFLSWVAGEVGHFYPFAVGRGYELKRQLVRAALAGIEAIWEVAPHARIVHTDPVIHIVPNPDRPDEAGKAESYRLSQFEAWDMIAGRKAPDLGGRPHYLDILGVNYYPHNQWLWDGPTIPCIDPHYRPFRQILRELHQRYAAPMFIAETSSLGEARPEWLRYVGAEVRAALRDGIPIEGLCIYPVVDTPDWNNYLHIHQGLWGMADETGARPSHPLLLRELRRQQRLLRRIRPLTRRNNLTNSAPRRREQAAV